MKAWGGCLSLSISDSHVGAADETRVLWGQSRHVEVEEGLQETELWPCLREARHGYSREGAGLRQECGHADLGAPG